MTLSIAESENKQRLAAVPEHRARRVSQVYYPAAAPRNEIPIRSQVPTREALELKRQLSDVARTKPPPLDIEHCKTPSSPAPNVA